MSIQEGFAAALRLIRMTKGLNQKDLSGTVTGSHVSQLESGKTYPTVKVAGDLAQALDLSPSALLAVAMACDSGATPRAVLLQAIKDLESLGLIDQVPPASADALDGTHPTSLRAAAVRAKVQELKRQGLKQVEVAKELELPRTTVQRHWH
ncbi:helix-turn-helix domain-containing protein [Pseudomonas qingdaonensis]|uniref:Helix-turn-helix domain-containing protein n=1 Tax=Pseudomonas qingdaonensis TaxID=2056231 RepID=A0ABX8DL92_9PSED|nr:MULTISPECIES: helix-turn-helix domain-containing protein [Pseudomonas]MDD1955650.1 helix-turn-helix domain-containing protein [Pseudomonas sp. 8209]MEC6743532.1 helix-turn-helix domain-containing protein [Pseudomonas qingdaonensis]PPS62439.1 Fis family transcriptional regulator [Pseudomonas sp. BRM28]QVL16969.1 helix-turn-helix domain-containing protein [Pseudomonas qingdaonensis]